MTFRITDPTSKLASAGLADVQALVFEPPGVWQQRRTVTEEGDGVNVLEQVFPHAGVYHILLAAESRGTHFADLRPHTVKVMAADKSAVGDALSPLEGRSL